MKPAIQPDEVEQSPVPSVDARQEADARAAIRAWRLLWLLERRRHRNRSRIRIRRL